MQACICADWPPQLQLRLFKQFKNTLDLPTLVLRLAATLSGVAAITYGAKAVCVDHHLPCHPRAPGQVALRRSAWVGTMNETLGKCPHACPICSHAHPSNGLLKHNTQLAGCQGRGNPRTAMAVGQLQRCGGADSPSTSCPLSRPRRCSAHVYTSGASSLRAQALRRIGMLCLSDKHNTPQHFKS